MANLEQSHRSPAAVMLEAIATASRPYSQPKLPLVGSPGRAVSDHLCVTGQAAAKAELWMTKTNSNVTAPRKGMVLSLAGARMQRPYLRANPGARLDFVGIGSPE